MADGRGGEYDVLKCKIGTTSDVQNNLDTEIELLQHHMKCSLGLLGGVRGQGGDLSNSAHGLRTVSGSHFGPSNCQNVFRIVMGGEIPEYVSSRHLQGL